MSEQNETTAPLFDQRIAIGASPISGSLPAGGSMRYEPEFEAIETEVKKIDTAGLNVIGLICPLQSGPSTILVWTLKERENGQETRA